MRQEFTLQKKNFLYFKFRFQIPNYSKCLWKVGNSFEVRRGNLKAARNTKSGQIWRKKGMGYEIKENRKVGNGMIDPSKNFQFIKMRCHRKIFTERLPQFR